ncbi:MAG: GAF domain-containing sensor histidine kinase [Actinomycetota bacterium]
MDERRERALIDAGLVLSAELPLDLVLQRIIELAVAITGARYGAMGVLGEDGRIDEFITEGVSPTERARIGDPPTGHGILGALIRERRPMRLPDIAADRRSSGFPPNHPPMHSFLGAPVSARGTVFGNIYLTEKRGAPEFTEGDEQALVVLATQAGVAVENARLHQETRRQHDELQRLSVLEDRERIAKELHDGVIQSLFAVGMDLQAGASRAKDEELGRRIEGAVGEIDRAIRDLRNYIFGLRPGVLADRQLHQALRALGTEFETRSGVVTVVDVDDETAGSLASRAGDLVQMTREALSNVGRHAQAETCRVSLRRGKRDGTAVLEIDDDGVGIDLETLAEGMGLANLRDRVRALGGDIAFEGTAGEGTTLRLTIPI